MSRFFGTPDGIRVGQQFIDRRELHDLHVHRPLQAGISGTKAEGADSIVVSGGYIDDEDHGNWVVYTGHGGNDSSTGRQIGHQTIDAPGNAGLVTSRAEGLPLRVIRGRHAGSLTPLFPAMYTPASSKLPIIGFERGAMDLILSDSSETGCPNKLLWLRARLPIQTRHSPPHLCRGEFGTPRYREKSRRFTSTTVRFVMK